MFTYHIRIFSLPSVNLFHIKKMEIKILEYERKIEILEKKVADLEKYNAGLRECFLQNIQFSTKLSNITYEMDCLLVKKSQQIRDLETKLDKSLAEVNSIQSLEPKIEDFDIDMTFKKDNETDDLNSLPLDVNEYVDVFECVKPRLKRDSNGYFNCPKCTYKTPKTSNIETHFRGHNDEKPFGCKLCEKRFTSKDSCICHIRRHDDRFKLRCTVCNETFIKTTDIIHHTKSLHNGMGYERRKRLIKRKRE